MDTSLFLVGIPGLEPALEAEATTLGFAGVARVAGGVNIAGGQGEAVRANLHLRSAVRVLMRVAEFRAMHLAQLDKRARKVPWGDWLRPDVPVRVEAVCHRSKIYVNKAASERVARAISEELGAPIAAEAQVMVKVRIDDDLCTISLDTTGEALHRRGHKQAVGKAPLRETMAAAFLREMGFDGTQCVVDPMCGSGTIPIEAAEIAAGLVPGRSRDFAFRHMVGFVGFDPASTEVVVQAAGPMMLGYDRDAGAIAGATANAARSGVGERCQFARQAVSDLLRPEGPPGIVLVNPPYGGRIGERKLLFGLYGALGAVLRERFGGWRVGVVTNDAGLAKAMGLDWGEALGPIDHGGLKVVLYRAAIAS